VLREAFARRRDADAPLVASFVAHEGAWLRDWALYSAFKEERGGAPWTAWEPDLRDREPAALAREAERLSEEVAFVEWTQCQFDLQWRTLRAYARTAGITLVGDLPMYVAHDSADVWANRSLFDLDALGMPVSVAGVPPDYFSREGQRWGNPLYSWDEHRRTGFSYWCARVEKALERFDEVRLDHFVGLVRAWEIPAHEPTAERGRFVEVPGELLLSTLEERFGVLPFVAEDLGIVPREARRLRRAHGFPGMRILQFAFGDDTRADEFLPHAYPRRTFVYTGTHDNDTAVGWYRDDGSGRASPRSPERIAEERRKLLRYVGEADEPRSFDPAEALVRLAYASVADTVVVPVQDVLGEDGTRRTNVPGTASGNWRYRMPPTALSEADCRRLRALAETYDRLPAARRPTPGKERPA
jgi:4-alpha-glucanotransferase